MTTDRTPDAAAWSRRRFLTVGATASGLALRLLETEGRGKRFRLQLFKPPTTARQRDFRGHTVQTLQVEGDCVLVSIAAHEVCEVEVTFA